MGNIVPYRSYMVPYSSYMVPCRSYLGPYRSYMVACGSYIVPYMVLYMVPYRSDIVPYSSEMEPCLYGTCSNILCITGSSYIIFAFPYNTEKHMRFPYEISKTNTQNNIP